MKYKVWGSISRIVYLGEFEANNGVEAMEKAKQHQEDNCQETGGETIEPTSCRLVVGEKCNTLCWVGGTIEASCCLDKGHFGKCRGSDDDLRKAVVSYFDNAH